jgi:hypothetical protein
MLLFGLLAAMMLVASPVLAHQGGPTHGNKYSKNYYPNGYFKYCEPDGSNYYGKTWYWVHVYYYWKTPDGKTHKWDHWYYCAYHKYNDPNSTKPYFKAWVTYKPTGKHYWESFYYWKSSTH